MVVRYYDVVIIGAGMGGIYQVHKLSQLGLSVRVIERAEGPGGTWYWNRYPGAMSDVHSTLYRYSWDKEDLQKYPWSHNYLNQKDILEYLNHVVDRHDLRKHMQFGTEVKSMKWNDQDYTWSIQTDDGLFTSRYVVTALGLLTEPNWPAITGLEKFQGELYHTARWPTSYDFSNKKVGVIGNGSTGVQVITTIAPNVGSLTSFQRHPQYSIPAGRKAVSKDERDEINQNYETIWAQARDSMSAAGFLEANIKAFDVSKEERDRVYQDCWDKGSGIRFLVATFADLITDVAANETACEFLRGKIAEIVQDPEKRRKLTPKDLYCRRPLCDTGYYDQFNRDNVDIIDIKENPIAAIEAHGIRLNDGAFHKLDVLVCATGFNAFDGAYRKINIQGRNGLTLADAWKDGPHTNMAVASHGFPNLFMILGPKAPLSNVPPMLEANVDFVTSAIRSIEARRKFSPDPSKVAFESTKKGDDEWGEICDAVNDQLVFKHADSYYFGANIPGKVRSTLVFFGGMKPFAQKLRESIDNGYPSFSFI